MCGKFFITIATTDYSFFSLDIDESSKPHRTEASHAKEILACLATICIEKGSLPFRTPTQRSA